MTVNEQRIYFENDIPSLTRLKRIVNGLHGSDPRRFLLALPGGNTAVLTGALQGSQNPSLDSSSGSATSRSSYASFFQQEDVEHLVPARWYRRSVGANQVSQEVLQLLHKWVNADPELHTRWRLFSVLFQVIRYSGLWKTACDFLRGTNFSQGELISRLYCVS